MKELPGNAGTGASHCAAGRAFVASIRSSEHCSEAGAWSFVRALPAASLAPYVTNFWEVRGDFNFAVDRIFPSDEAALVVNLGSAQQVDMPSGERREYEDAWISGVQLAPLTTISPPGTWICGARLTARGSFLALGVAPASLAGEVVELDRVKGRMSDSLAGRVRDAAGVVERFNLLGRAILSWSQDGPDWSGPVGHVLGSMRGARGRIPVRALAREVDWSRQRLHRAFVDLLGISPKSMSRLLRFRNAVDLIGFDADVDLAGVAQRSGYFDQAHFGHEFLRFSGMTPGRYLRSRIPTGERGFELKD